MKTEGQHNIASKTYFFLALVVAALGPGSLSAIDVTRPVDREGEAIDSDVAKAHRWPDTALKLLNDPRRTLGKSSWYSFSIYNSYSYGFRVKSTRDLFEIAAQYAQLEDTDLTVTLSPFANPKSHDDVGVVLHLYSEPHPTPRQQQSGEAVST